MAKVFRIHSSGESKTGWFQSSPIGATELETIKADTEGTPTSIPSPFARIDLVKSAFRWVANNNLIGETDNHKLVSDALDIAQLFFLSNNAQYKNDIKIVEWNPRETFDKYRDKSASSFFSSLEVFWKEDARIYNFDKVDKLTFIYYKNKLVGSTSPSTLFVSSPDATSENLEMNITRGSDRLLDKKYAALHEREFPFVNYMFSLAHSIEFADCFNQVGKNEIREYFDAVRRSLSPQHRSIIDKLNSTSYLDYPACTTSESNTNKISILGIRLGTEIKTNAIDSDFFIKSTKNIKRALVLPQKRFNEPWKYTSSDDLWNAEELTGKIPKENTDLDTSHLPQNGTEYLWLSEGNFLSDQIMTLEATSAIENASSYPINRTDFNTEILDDNTNCLLPLTDTFFKYFNAEEAKNLCEIKRTGVLYNVTLKIPVENGAFIEFEKTYKVESQININICLAISSLIKGIAPDAHNYIGFQYSLDDKLQYSCTPLTNGGQDSTSRTVVRDSGERTRWKTEIIKTQEDFDYLKITINNTSNYLIPKWRHFIKNTNKIDFAIDFGTTNTHIEYKKEDETVKSFEFINNSGYLTYLIDYNKWGDIPNGDIKIRYPFFEKFLFPMSMSGKADIHFPTRTAITYNESINFSNKTDAFLDGNSFVLYEKQAKGETQKLKTDIKWSNYGKKEEETLVELYIESILQLVRLKAINEGCKPNDVKIKWFYPVSMNSHEVGIFTTIWENYYAEIFSGADKKNLIRIPESIAPYLFYRNQYPGTSMTIDIGGGSTDIALFDKDSPEASYITSFRYAGDSIFGDGYKSEQRALDTDRNGFVNIFKDKVKELLENSGQRDKKDIQNRILEETKDSANYVNFLFSLEADNQLNFNFAKELRRDRSINLSFLLFYSSLFYYSAVLQKKIGKPIPKNFIFSGTASKSLLFLDNSPDQYKTKELIAHFYSHVLETAIEPNEITIALDKNPKEVTAKGGLKLTDRDKVNDDQIQFWLGGSKLLDKVVNKQTDVKSTPRYEEIAKEHQTEIKNSILSFYKTLDTFLDGRRLDDQFNIDIPAIDKFNEIRENNLDEFINWGVESYTGQKGNHIEETLFFFPLIGVLNRLSFELSNLKRQ
ncbi:hypothetical protein ACV07N_13275 [Roseivirga echinicomitans]